MAKLIGYARVSTRQSVAGREKRRRFSCGDACANLGGSCPSRLQIPVAGVVLRAVSQPNCRLSKLFISHDLAVVRQIATDVVVMERGTSVDRGGPEQLFSKPTELYTQRLVSAISESLEMGTDRNRKSIK